MLNFNEWHMHLFLGMTTAFLQALTCQGIGPRAVFGRKRYLQLYPLQAAVMAVGPLVLFQLPNCGKLAGGQHWALEAGPGSKLGVNKTMSPVGSGGSGQQDQGRTHKAWTWRLSLLTAAVSKIHASALCISIKTQNTPWSLWNFDWM